MSDYYPGDDSLVGAAESEGGTVTDIQSIPVEDLIYLEEAEE